MLCFDFISCVPNVMHSFKFMSPFTVLRVSKLFKGANAQRYAKHLSWTSETQKHESHEHVANGLCTQRFSTFFEQLMRRRYHNMVNYCANATYQKLLCN